MPDASALYPQPPAPPEPSSSLMSDPLRALSALGQINSLLEFSGRRAAAGALQNAINPDGSIDRGRLMEGLKNSPIVTPGAMTDALTAHNVLIQNDTAQFEQWAKQSDYARQNFAARLNQKTPITAEQVRHDQASMSTNADPRALPSSVIANMADSILNDPAGVNQAYRNMGARVMGPAAALTPAPAPPTAGGVEQKQPLIQFGQAPAPGGAPAGSAVPVGNPPGTEESSKFMQEELRRQGNFGQEIYPLQRALELAQKLGPGGMAPGSKGRQDFESFIYGLAPELVPAGMQDKIKNYAELEKYLTQNMSMRANNLGPHTNEGLATAVTGSPSVHINDLAGVDLIKAGIMLRRMEYAQVQQAAKSGPVQYAQKKAQFAPTQDPRAYGIDLASPDQIQQWQKSLKGKERDRFNLSLRSAIDSGVVLPQQ